MKKIDSFFNTIGEIGINKLDKIYQSQIISLKIDPLTIIKNENKILRNSDDFKNKKLINTNNNILKNINNEIKYTEMVEKGNKILNNIISSLKENTSYELSDWEDEEAMKNQDFDLDDFDVPIWATKENIKLSMNRQTIIDGEKLFINLPRRCNLNEIFETNKFKYYSNKK